MSIDGHIDGRCIPSRPIRLLSHLERIDWHRHDGHQLIYPRRGVLRVFTASGVWVVPPSQGVWIPAGTDHAHRACGTTEMRAILFAIGSPGPFIAHPTVLAFTPLLREAVTSERTLSRLFRERAGMTFAQWRGQFRLHHALVLLAEGHQVTRIAGACGYASPSAFIGAFREAFGLTPGEYLRREPDLRM
jgi:AraC-like DNA-binding protein